MELEDIIIERIRTEGPLSFRDYMHMCLYYPGMGYYTSGVHPVGWQGDFYTSCTLTPAFGMAIARQLEELWTLLGKQQFTVVEYGAGTGKLCQGILQYLQHNAGLYQALQYCMIEHPQLQCDLNEPFHEKISRYADISEVPYKIDCVLSNELLDNFAVHRVVMQQQLMEVHVTYVDGFKEILLPANDQLQAYFQRQGIQLPAGHYAEVNLQAKDWLDSVGRNLQQGYVLTLDYGYPGSELYKHSRASGTLVCYNKHLISDDYYNYIGKQDITAHVNFSALEMWGAEQGLQVQGFTDQAHFLKRLGFEELLANSQLCGFLPFTKQTFLKYILMHDLGRKILVLLQGKNVPHLPLGFG